MVLIIVIVALVVIFLAGRGTPYGSHPYYNSGFGLVGTIVVILLILWLIGALPVGGSIR